jgi:hypothetical protein
MKSIFKNSDILSILKFNNITEFLDIKFACLIFNKETIFFKVFINNALPIHVIFEIQDKLYFIYKIDIEIQNK